MSFANTNTTGDFIRSIFPTCLNKNGDIFKALFANENATKENEQGAIEGIFNTLEKERQAWFSSSVYEQVGEQLEKTLKALSVWKRGVYESDDNYKEYNKILYKRGGDTIWGTSYDILNIFKLYFMYFFKNDKIYIANNTDVETNNLISNSNFLNGMQDWTFDNCILDETKDNVFCGTQSIKFLQDGASCSCIAKVEKNKPYFLHFFLAGSVKVCIKDDFGRYYNFAKSIKNGKIKAFWQDTKDDDCYQSFAVIQDEMQKEKQYQNESLLFVCDSDVANVSIIFEGKENTMLDYARLFLKTQVSTFSIIGVFPDAEKKVTDTGGLAPHDTLQDVDGKQMLGDYVPDVDYKIMPYYDKKFILKSNITSLQKIYNTIMSIVAPVGVIAYFDILEKKI